MNKGQFKLYTASAGSGKTYTLVREYLTLSLFSENVSCKDILAVTFTNKAVNEMKVKILSYLNGFICGNPDESMKNDLINALKIDENTLIRRSKALYDNILHNYSDFNISTIDGFVQQVSRSFAKELNLPAQYRVLLDDDDLLDGLIQCVDARIDKNDNSITEILTDFVDFQLDEENSLRIDVLLRDFVAKLLKESAYKKGEILNLKELSGDEYLQTKDSLDGLYNKYKTNVLNDIQIIRDFENEFAVEITDYNNGARGGLPSVLTKIEKDINVKPSLLVGTIISKIFCGDKSWFSKSIDKLKVDDINKSGIDVLKLYGNLIENHKSLFLVGLVRKNIYLYALRATLLSVINQYIDDTNKVHISEFNKRISDILGDCSIPFIYEKIGSRYKHFFVDEFQDTSLLQWHNFLPLVNNGLSEGNMSLLVGDAKQAIYRFRNGEVEQIMNLPSIYDAKNNDFYAECENTLKNSFKKESLGYNFRSKKNIIDFNNSFFSISKNKLTSENYRKVYDDLEQKCPKKYSYDGFVSVELFEMNEFSDEEESANELYKNAVKESILNDINKLKDNGFALRDIAVLVRSNSDSSDIAEFLSKNNVPVMSSDSILLKSSDKVRLIILTLKCLLDDENDVDKLSLSFYKNICNDIDSYDIQKALNDDFDFDKIYGIRNQAYSIYDLCCKIINIYNFNIIEDEFLQYFMNHVLEWQNTENNGIDAFIEHWNKKSDALYVKIASEIDAVNIMTIHKSKGLEYKVVMYPYAYTKVPGDFKGAEKWLPLDDIKLLKDIKNIDSFILPINKGLVGTEMEHHYIEEVEKAAFDDFNIMYVAMTRARDLLFIYSNKIQTEEEKTSESYNFFMEYFDADNGYENSYAEGETSEKEDVDLIKNRFVTVSNDKSIKYELGTIEYHKDKEKEEKDVLELKSGETPQLLDWTRTLKIEPEPTMFWAEDDDNYMPKEWGNLVHDILSKINTIEDADRVFANYVNEGSIDKQKADKLKRQFEKIVDLKEVKEAYSKNAIVRNEIDILTYDSSINENVILRPDRYAELEDKVILIDYKTGMPQEEYDDQLKNYMQALRGMGVEKIIEAYLIYINKADENIDIKPVFLDTLF